MVRVLTEDDNQELSLKEKDELERQRRENEAEIARLATFETLAREIDKLVENIKGAGRKVSPLVRKRAGMLGKATSVLFTRVQYPNGMPLETAERPAARADCDPDLLDLLRETAKSLGRIAALSEGSRVDDDVIEQLAHNAGELRRAAGHDGDAQSEKVTWLRNTGDLSSAAFNVPPMDQYHTKVLITLWHHQPVLMTIEQVMLKTNFARDKVCDAIKSI